MTFVVDKAQLGDAVLLPMIAAFNMFHINSMSDLKGFVVIANGRRPARENRGNPQI